MKNAVWDLKSQFESYKNIQVFDCLLAEFLLSEGRFVPEQEKLFQTYKVTTLDELADKQLEKFNELPALYSLFTTIEQPLSTVLYTMEKTGISLDTQRLQAVGEEINQAANNLETDLKKDVGYEINLNSSIQVGEFLAEKLLVPLSKTKTGRYATNESEISQYADQYPFIQKLLSFRELSKLRSTYVDSLISKVDDQGRVHTTYGQTSASTGRLSSTNPNLQNIPVSSVFGQKIKGCFVASPGHVLLSFDYSQQELRILAHLTGEEKLIHAFQNKRDIHTTTASQIFHVAYEAVTKEQRMIAKTINFGIVYGMSSYGMSAQLHIPVEEAQHFIDTFNATYPNIQKYYESYLKEGKVNRYVETILGRRRYVFEYPGQKFIDNAMRRVLINYPIQGSAADLMKKAMIQIHKEIIETDKTVKLLLQIHDDLVFEVPNDPKKIQEMSEKIREIMCNIYPLAVPVEVDVKMGKNWGEMKSISVS